MAQAPTVTRTQSLSFLLRSNLLKLALRLHDPAPASAPILAESITPLFTSTNPAEFALQAGKIHNLRLARRALHGRHLIAGQVFSFWAHVPRPTRANGFAPGRELRGGCIIPTTGGGLCQISNALYDLALTAGFTILERHAHSSPIPDSTVPPGRDATVFWNYIDLRFRPHLSCRLEIDLTATDLIVRLRSLAPATPLPILATAPAAPHIHTAASCETCGVASCFRHSSATSLESHSRTAWLVDAFHPEHNAYLTATHRPDDFLFTPLDSRRWRIGPYHWDSRGFASVIESPTLVAQRSYASRRLAREGATLRRATLDFDAALAAAYARRIPATALHLVISQNLLPFLWREGVLGGRTFDVLMTRLPMRDLELQLNRAAAHWPDSPTLADFRADPSLVAAESAALAAARLWITPHTAIRGTQCHYLPWQAPTQPALPPGSRLVFPATTVSRKGARDLRAALAGTGLTLHLAGPLVEGSDFWGDIPTIPTTGDWLADARAVVLPAWVEHQPRRLLRALAAGIPVIATPSCGLPPQPHLTLVNEGDIDALRTAICRIMRG